MKTTNTQAQPEQNQTPTLDDLQHPFAGICFAYGSIFTDRLSNSDLIYRLKWLVDDADKLAAIAKQLHSNVCGGVQ